MKTNAEGIALIKECEGLRLKPYICSGGKLTVGWGSTGRHVRPDVKITEEQAEEYLAKDLAKAEAAVMRLIRVPLNSNQFSALVSFVFNLGEGNLRDSTLRRLLNQRHYLAAADQFPRWNLAGGKKQPGLVKRRAKERALFLKPVLVKEG